MNSSRDNSSYNGIRRVQERVYVSPSKGGTEARTTGCGRLPSDVIESVGANESSVDVSASRESQYQNFERVGRRLEIFSPCSSALRSETSGRDVGMKRGEDPSSLCKLIAAGAKYTVSVEVTEGRYSSTRHLTFFPVCPIARESLGRKCSDDVLDRLILSNQVYDNSCLCSVFSVVSSDVKKFITDRW